MEVLSVFFPILFSAAAYILFSIKREKKNIYIAVSSVVITLYLMGSLYFSLDNSEYNTVVFDFYVILFSIIGLIATVIAAATKYIFTKRNGKAGKIKLPIILFVLVVLFIYWFIDKGLILFF